MISAAAMKLPGISGLLKKPQQVKAVSESVSESVKNLYYGKNPLGSGDLTRSERMTGEETALKIRMSDPESLYLRGFVGEIYTGDSWDTLSTGTYYGSENLMYWLKELGFNTLGQLGQASELTDGNVKENHIQVDVENADRRYAYIPYEISELSVDKSRNWGGSFVTSRKFGRLSSYDYTAGENAVKDWTKTAAVMFTNAADKGRGDEITSYLTFESYYNELVYKNDTYLSESDKELISEYLGPSGDQSKGHIEYKEAINRIKTYLDESFIYTEYPGPLNSSGGALESFLSSGKGSDVQYATAAVMMFRYYGIPARYVEGYLVTPEDVKGITSEDTIEIPQSRAHAWAEIYVDGIGFVPVEVCPEYEGVMEEADMTVGISNNTLIRPFEDTSDNSQDSQNELRDGGDDDRQPTDIYLILAVILITAVIVFILILILRTFFGKLKKALKKRRLIIKAAPKSAVSAIYGYMEQEGYPVNEAIRDLGNRAAYSREEIQEEERKWMLEEYKRLKKERTKWDICKRNSEQLPG